MTSILEIAEALTAIGVKANRPMYPNELKMLMYVADDVNYQKIASWMQENPVGSDNQKALMKYISSGQLRQLQENVN